MLKDAFEFVQILIKLTEHLISSSANRSQRSAPKCKGFYNLHGLLPVGIYVRVCGCVYERERETEAENERETKKENFDLATVSGEALLRAWKQTLAAARWWGLLLLNLRPN